MQMAQLAVVDFAESQVICPKGIDESVVKSGCPFDGDDEQSRERIWRKLCMRRDSWLWQYMTAKARS